MKTLLIGHVWPEPHSSAAGSRTLQLVRLFRAQDWPVTFAVAADPSGHDAELRQLDVDCVRIVLNDSSFDAFVRENSPELVVFDRFAMEEQFGWRVEREVPSALRLLDTVDLHLLRKARQLAVEEQREVAPGDLASETALREVAAILRSDLTLLTSDHEFTLLTSRFPVPVDLLSVVPLLYDLEAAASFAEFEHRRGFVSIGNFRHPPNADSILWAKQAIWPQIKQRLPDAEFRIYGAYPNARMLALTDEAASFRVLGWIPDAAAALARARVCLAPLRFSAGIRGKLAEAMLAGTPSVTTPVGAEGMTGGLPWAGAIALAPEELAHAAVHLHEHRETWEQAQRHGRKILEHLFDERQVGPRLIERLVSLKARLEDARSANFVGALLRHHHHRSTEYMARWIEAKNRRPQ